MSDIAISVLAKLKNKAKESGRSYQLCLQLFCQEEFLRRLENLNTPKILYLKADYSYFPYGLYIYSGFPDLQITQSIQEVPHWMLNSV